MADIIVTGYILCTEGLTNNHFQQLEAKTLMHKFLDKNYASYKAYKGDGFSRFDPTSKKDLSCITRIFIPKNPEDFSDIMYEYGDEEFIAKNEKDLEKSSIITKVKTYGCEDQRNQQIIKTYDISQQIKKLFIAKNINLRIMENIDLIIGDGKELYSRQQIRKIKKRMNYKP